MQTTPEQTAELIECIRCAITGLNELGQLINNIQPANAPRYLCRTPFSLTARLERALKAATNQNTN